MAADFGETLDLMEKRVTALERRLLTNDEDVKKFEQSSCLLTLVQTQQELNRLSSKYPSIANAWGKNMKFGTHENTEVYGQFDNYQVHETFKAPTSTVSSEGVEMD